jgi:hypothetical protein
LPALKPEKSPEEVKRSPQAAQAFAERFESITEKLKARRYQQAGSLLKRWYGYVDGTNATEYGDQDQFFFEHKVHEAFVAAYQAQFCSGSGYLPHPAVDAGDDRLFGQALSDAIAGRYDAALRTAYSSSAYDVNFPQGLLLAGELELVLHQREKARNTWMRALAIRGFVYPEEIGPTQTQIVAAEYLLHFRL